MQRLAVLMATLLALATSASAQAVSTIAGTTTTVPPVEMQGRIAAGEEVVDDQGRRVTNNGTNANGSLKITYTGTLTWDNQNPRHGTIRGGGGMSSVTNPRTSGSDGPIVIDCANAPLVVNIDSNGGRTGSVTTTITNGIAGVVVNITGNNQDFTVGGTGVAVSVTGNDNSGQGAVTNPPSGGTVQLGGRNNSFRSNGGNWEFRS